jgi:cysteine desulfurase/selenocysteine lyase
MAFDVEKIRADFPILSREVRGRPLVYLDSAATSQKPRVVIDAIAHYYEHTNANVHRGVHLLSVEATQAFEGARAKVQRHIGASSTKEVVFCRGTTEAINLVSQAFLRPRLATGDEIVVSHLEHHSNIVPWQIVAAQTGAVIRVARIDERGEIDLDYFTSLLGPRTKLVAVSHIANSLGTINPIEEIIALARAHGAHVVVDGAQAVPHQRVDVAKLDVDFYAFSGHKMYGPTGIGVLYGKRELLEAAEPYQGGGDMIRSVSFESTTYNELPYKLEAGTPDIAGAIGLGAAIDYLEALDWPAVQAHEDLLVEVATKRLSDVPGLRLIGTAQRKIGVVSFVMEGVHPHDVGTIVDQEGVAVRTGHHCAQPVMQHFGVPATTRASFGLYNTLGEIDRLIDALDAVRRIFAL